jgi:ubiquinone/menaquinone biosynthesis C-methylase UbiE
MKEISYPRFARRYNQAMQRPSIRHFFDPLRQITLQTASGVVLEIGAGGGQNFPFYNTRQVTRVEAIEPDASMREHAHQQLPTASVPIHLQDAPVEQLPFPDHSFDTVVATLVFCSVQDPQQGLREIRRVLKPGGQLLLLEHVRSANHVIGWLQGLLVPLTTRCLGNCHWNRDTQASVLQAGFQIQDVEQKGNALQPILILKATYL